MAVTYATRKSSSEKLHPFCHRPTPFFFFFFTTISSEEEPGLLHSNDDVAFNTAVDRKNLVLGYDLMGDVVNNIRTLI